MNAIVEKIAHLVASRDFLVYQRNMELRSEYVSKLGQYELGAFKLSCDAERMRRKMELAREQIEKGEALDEEMIDMTLMQEFAVKDHMLEEMMGNLFMVMGFQSMPKISREDQSSMLHAYEQLTQIYYPDLYPQDETKLERWEEIQDLYQQWDLDGLETLLREAEAMGLAQELETTLDEDQLLHLQETVEQDIDAILQSFPFNLKELLDDEEEIEKHRIKVQRTAEKAEREIEELSRQLKMLFEPVSKNLN